MIAEFFKEIHPVEADVLEDYMSNWEAFEAPRKFTLTGQGQTERYMYYVQEGIQKSYHLYDGKPHVIAFTYPPSFSGIPESFFTQRPSKYFLETLTASSFIRISYEKHQASMAKHRSIETLFRKATELVLVGFIERHFELMAYDIETRFRSFVARSPQLLGMVPHKDLASYLRIDPTNFSKLLKQWEG